MQMAVFLTMLSSIEQGDDAESSAEFKPVTYNVSEHSTPGFKRLSVPRTRSSSQQQQPELQAILDSIHKASEKGAKRMTRLAPYQHSYIIPMASTLTLESRARRV
jgi:hypothetical protein